ncbi:protein of unknown function [Pararobbsia alpina]
MRDDGVDEVFRYWRQCSEALRCACRLSRSVDCAYELIYAYPTLRVERYANQFGLVSQYFAQ